MKYFFFIILLAMTFFPLVAITFKDSGAWEKTINKELDGTYAVSSIFTNEADVRSLFSDIKDQLHIVGNPKRSDLYIKFFQDMEGNRTYQVGLRENLFYKIVPTFLTEIQHRTQEQALSENCSLPRLPQINISENIICDLPKEKFNILIHTTNEEGALGILSGASLIPWKDLDPKLQAIKNHNLANSSVIYTMLYFDWFIKPTNETTEIPASIIFEFPLSIIKNNKGHISNAWWYGNIDNVDNSGYFDSEKGFNILSEKESSFNKELQKLVTYNKCDVPQTIEDLKNNYFSRRHIEHEIQNEVIFYDSLDLKEIPAFKIYFANEEQLNNFKEKNSSILKNWTIISEGSNLMGAWYLEVSHSNQKD